MSRKLQAVLVLVGAAAIAGGLVVGRGSSGSSVSPPRLALHPASPLATALHASLAPDTIRALDAPLFDTPSEAHLLRPSDLVLGLALGGQAHAYPVGLLSLHEVVNDTLGSTPVAVTFCPLCQTGLAFDRRVGGRTLRFGVSGLLLYANQVLFDRETGSLWSQLLGRALTGPFRGSRLRTLPLVEETWAAWRAQHPRTLVLSLARDPRGADFTHPYSYGDRRGEESSDDPYAGYVTKESLYGSRLVRGLRDGALVLGALVDGRAKAYAEQALRRRRVLDDRVGGQPLLVTWDDGALAGSVYLRRLGGRTLSFRPAGQRLVDRETGSAWEAATGRAVAGPLRGSQLLRLPAPLAYWFAWRTFHPRTALLVR